MEHVHYAPVREMSRVGVLGYRQAQFGADCSDYGMNILSPPLVAVNMNVNLLWLKYYESTIKKHVLKYRPHPRIIKRPLQKKCNESELRVSWIALASGADGFRSRGSAPLPRDGADAVVTPAGQYNNPEDWRTALRIADALFFT